MKKIFATFIFALLSLGAFANSSTTTTDLLNARSESELTTAAVKEAADCLIIVEEEYEVYIEIGSDYIYIEETTTTTVTIICW